MLRINFLKYQSFETFNLSHNLIGAQSVRWRRKPRWIPTAPSKIFRVPERTVLSPLFDKEWLRLNNNYRTQVNSLRRYLIQEVEDKKEKINLQATPADEAAEFQRCLSLNQQWNQVIAESRSIRIESENEQRREQILLNIEKKKVRDEEVMRQVEEKVKREEIQSESYITRENIDKTIEHALANPVDFNFSIDLLGKRSDELANDNLPQ